MSGGCGLSLAPARVENLRLPHFIHNFEKYQTTYWHIKGKKIAPKSSLLFSTGWKAWATNAFVDR
jgi:hypothetical protein